MDLHDYACFSILFQHRLLSSVTGPSAAVRPHHTRPTRQHKVSSATDRASTPNSASEGRGKLPSRGRTCSVPITVGGHKNGIPARALCSACINCTNRRCCKCYYNCCTAVHGGWLGRWVGYVWVAVGVLVYLRRPRFFGPLALHRTIQQNTQPCFVLARCCAYLTYYLLLYGCT